MVNDNCFTGPSVVPGSCGRCWCATETYYRTLCDCAGHFQL